MSEQSAEIGELAKALSNAQGEILGALKESKNPFFKSNYADLASVWDACRRPLAKHSLAVIQTTEVTQEPGSVLVVTTLVHASGQWIRGRLLAKSAKPDIQGLGSAITYCRRYALSAIVGVAQIDDDGEGSLSRGVRPEQPDRTDGTFAQGEYRIPGYLDPKLAGKSPHDCDPATLRDIIVKVEEKYKGKIMPAGAVSFIKNCEPVVAAWENNPGAHEGG